MNTIVTVIVAILAMAIGCGLALFLSKKNAKSQANEIIEKNKRECTLDDIYNIALTSTNGNEEMASMSVQTAAYHPAPPSCRHSWW